MGWKIYGPILTQTSLFVPDLLNGASNFAAARCRCISGWWDDDGCGVCFCVKMFELLETFAVFELLEMCVWSEILVTSVLITYE